MSIITNGKKRRKIVKYQLIKIVKMPFIKNINIDKVSRIYI